MQVRQARVLVADGGGEELPEALFGFSGGREDGWGDAGVDPFGDRERGFDRC